MVSRNLNREKKNNQWVNFPMNITCISGNNPIKSANHEEKSCYLYDSNSKLLHIYYFYNQDENGSSGDGSYYFNLPSGFSADTNVVQQYKNHNPEQGNSFEGAVLGNCVCSLISTLGAFTGFVSLLSATALGLFINGFSIVNSKSTNLGSPVSYNFNAMLPVNLI